MKPIAWMKAPFILYLLMVFALFAGGLLVQGSSTTAAADELHWVLRETRINPDQAPTEFYGGGITPNYFTETRFKGKSDVYSVSETTITHASRDVDGGREFHNVTFTADFDKPESVIEPGETVTLKAKASGSGSVQQGAGGVGIIFEYFGEGVNLKGDTQAATSIQKDFATDSSEASFTVPNATKEGQQFTVQAVLWNCAACKVEWVYRVEPGAGSSSQKTASGTSTADRKNDRWVLKEIQINPGKSPKNYETWERSEPSGFPSIKSEHSLAVTEKDMLIDTMETVTWAEGDYRFFSSLYAGFDQPPPIMKPGDLVDLFVEVQASASSAENSALRPGGSQAINFRYTVEGVTLKGDAEARASLVYTPEVNKGLFDGWLVSLRDRYGFRFRRPAIGDHKVDSAESSFRVPEVEEGGTISITASVDDCPACYVSWKYVPGPDAPIELGTGGPEKLEDRELAPESCDELSRGLLPQVPYSPLPELLRQGYIGEIRATYGNVAHDYCSGGINRSASAGNLIRIGDCVRTGGKGLASITLYDRDEERGAGPSVINIASNTETCIEYFSVNYKQQWRKTTWELIKGKIREFSTGWGTNSSFSVKAGVSICGIRGSDVVVSYDPVMGKVDAYVGEGAMEVRKTAEDRLVLLNDGMMLSVEDGHIKAGRNLQSGEWDRLLTDNRLVDTAIEDASASEGMEDSGLESGERGKWPYIIATIVATTLILAGSLFVLRRKKKFVKE